MSIIVTLSFLGCLSVTDLRDVLEEIHDARTKWYNFDFKWK